jgi:hypothetical protein
MDMLFFMAGREKPAILPRGRELVHDFTRKR